MRKIKFRAKSLVDYETEADGIYVGDWVGGYYYYCRNKNSGVLSAINQIREIPGIKINDEVVMSASIPLSPRSALQSQVNHIDRFNEAERAKILEQWQRRGAFRNGWQ